jgi:hypothetical protein
MVARKHLNVTLHVHCLFVLFFDITLTIVMDVQRVFIKVIKARTILFRWALQITKPPTKWTYDKDQAPWSQLKLCYS